MGVGDGMKIVACCVTWNRPKMLGRLIECFERQTYANRELIILDDGGQYRDQPHGDRWRVISHGDRYPTLGEKRHAVAKLAMMAHADAMAIFDDDDLYLPHALEATVNGLEKNRWVQSREAYEWDGAEMKRVETFNRQEPLICAYHGGWAYRMDTYRASGGYEGHDEDNGLMRRMMAMCGHAGDTICPEFPEPFYVYSRERETQHLSESYQQIGFAPTWDKFAEKLQPAKLQVGWGRDYLAIPRPTVASPRLW